MKPARVVPVLAVAGLLAGCAGAPGFGSVGSPFEANPEDFLHDERLDGETSGTERFWRNGMASATVDYLVALEKGSVTVRVVDAAMATVYERSFAPGEDGRGSERAGSGRPGDWRVEILSDRAEGEVHLKVAPAP